MLRGIALGLPLLLLAPSAAAAGGDDWGGTMFFALAGEYYYYTFQGRDCSFPLECGSLREQFWRGDGVSFLAVPGASAWAFGSAGGFGRATGVFTFGAEQRTVTWYAVADNLCAGSYDGPLTVDGGTGGGAEAAKTSPGADGYYECTP